LTSKYIITKKYVDNKQCTLYSSMPKCSRSQVTHNRWQCLYQICELKVVEYQVDLDSVCKIRNSTLPWQCIIGKQTILFNYGMVRKRKKSQIQLTVTAENNSFDLSIRCKGHYYCIKVTAKTTSTCHSSSEQRKCYNKNTNWWYPYSKFLIIKFSAKPDPCKGKNIGFRRKMNITHSFAWLKGCVTFLFKNISATYFPKKASIRGTCGTRMREIFIPNSDTVLSNLLISRRPKSRHKQFKKNFLVSNPPSLLSI